MTLTPPHHIASLNVTVCVLCFCFFSFSLFPWSKDKFIQSEYENWAVSLHFFIWEYMNLSIVHTFHLKRKKKLLTLLCWASFSFSFLFDIMMNTFCYSLFRKWLSHCFHCHSCNAHFHSMWTFAHGIEKQTLIKQWQNETLSFLTLSLSFSRILFSNFACGVTRKKNAEAVATKR